MAETLRFPFEFFFAGDIEPPSTEDASFRSMASMTDTQRNSTLSSCAIAIKLVEWLETKHNLPRQDLPNMRGHSPNAAVEAIRGTWALGERPIKNMIHLLDSKGVRVFSLVEECRQD